jgi:hypothetical protein
MLVLSKGSWASLSQKGARKCDVMAIRAANMKEMVENEDRNRTCKQRCEVPERSSARGNMIGNLILATLTQEGTGPVCLRGDRSSQIAHGISWSKTFIPSPSAGSDFGTLICRNETVQLCRAVTFKRCGFAHGTIRVHVGAIIVSLRCIGVCRTGRDSVSDETRKHQQWR